MVRGGRHDLVAGAGGWWQWMAIYRSSVPRARAPTTDKSASQFVDPKSAKAATQQLM